MISDILDEIKSKIEDLFPTVNVIIDKSKDTDECFVLIDDENIYDSDEYQSFIAEQNFEKLLKNGISSVFFSYTSDYSVKLLMKPWIINQKQRWNENFEEYTDFNIVSNKNDKYSQCNMSLLEAA